MAFDVKQGNELLKELGVSKEDINKIDKLRFSRDEFKKLGKLKSIASKIFKIEVKTYINEVETSAKLMEQLATIMANQQELEKFAVLEGDAKQKWENYFDQYMSYLNNISKQKIKMEKKLQDALRDVAESFRPIYKQLGKKELKRLKIKSKREIVFNKLLFKKATKRKKVMEEIAADTVVAGFAATGAVAGRNFAKYGVVNAMKGLARNIKAILTSGVFTHPITGSIIGGAVMAGISVKLTRKPIKQTIDDFSDFQSLLELLENSMIGLASSGAVILNDSEREQKKAIKSIRKATKSLKKSIGPGLFGSGVNNTKNNLQKIIRNLALYVGLMSDAHKLLEAFIFGIEVALEDLEKVKQSVVTVLNNILEYPKETNIEIQMNKLVKVFEELQTNEKMDAAAIEEITNPYNSSRT